MCALCSCQLVSKETAPCNVVHDKFRSASSCIRRMVMMLFCNRIQAACMLLLPSWCCCLQAHAHFRVPAPASWLFLQLVLLTRATYWTGHNSVPTSKRVAVMHDRLRKPGMQRKGI